MQKIYVNSWLKNGQDNSVLNVDRENEIELDFTNVEDIKLKDIQRILLLQKFAVFHQLTLKAENMKPSVFKTFKQTGLYKMMNNFKPSTKTTTKKRQGLAFD